MQISNPISRFLSIILLSCGLLLSCLSGKEKQQNNILVISRSNILVDGDISDWASLPEITVNNKEHLWFGEDLPEGQWDGSYDLSYSWKVAWNNGKLFFLFEVIDDSLSGFDQEFAWMNDCIEIYIDPNKQGGSRISGIGPANTLENRIGKKMRGYEMQFLPSCPPKVFVDDSKGIYYTIADQTIDYKMQWDGEVFSKKTCNGYLMEIGFTVPGEQFSSGYELGLDIAVCDDDGMGRKNLLKWSGFKGSFWLTMDDFHKMVLE